MSDNLNVTLTITAQDHASPIIAKLKSDLDGLAKSINTAFKSPIDGGLLKSLSALNRQQERLQSDTHTRVAALSQPASNFATDPLALDWFDAYAARGSHRQSVA